MSARETLNRFSAALLRDESVFSAQEKELLARLLQRIQPESGDHNDGLSASIARAVGEIVLERASVVLGESIIQQLRSQRVAGCPETSNSFQLLEELASLQQNERLGPRPPGPNPGPIPPGPVPIPPRDEPIPGPRPPGPNPPGISQEWSAGRAKTGVLDLPDVLPGECVVLDEFLAPAELACLTRYVLEREVEFKVSEVVSPGEAGGAVEFEHRRSRVLMDLGPHRDVILKRLEACLPQVLKKLGREPFPISRIEAQVTSSNDGDYFRWHTDNGQDEVSTREITFVYFFHREPRPFGGGELRLYDSQRIKGAYVPTSHYRAIVPEQNQMVLFVSSLAHEITPVESPNGRFADSRFTVNGWLNR
jgi:hypothetical protein